MAAAAYEHDKFIQNCASEFVKELYKLERLEPNSCREEFKKLIGKYDKLFVERFSQSQENANLVDQIRRLENPDFSRNQVPNAPSFIPDGRINPNLNRLSSEGTNPLGGSFNPFSMLGNGPTGLPPSRDAYPNVFGSTKPSMEAPLPLAGNPAGGFSSSHGFDIHANSKHYFPKDAEFLTNDYVQKPGAKFNANRNAVLIKDDRAPGVDPNLEELRKNLKRYENAGPSGSAQGQSTFAGFVPPSHNPYTSNNFPVAMPHAMTFNPQVGNSRYENDQNLQRHIQQLGGTPNSLEAMQQSLLDHEMKFMGRNTLDPKNNNSVNQEAFNPYAFQAGLSGQNAGAPRPPLPAGYGSSTAAYSPDVMAGMQGMFGVTSKLSGRPETTQIEVGRMMRADLEQRLASREKETQRFKNFSRMLKSTIPGQAPGNSFSVN